MNKGSCLCGAVTYETKGEPVAVSHCHCTMCQKQHGAAFATYARFRKADLKYITGADKLSVYNSSNDILRKFCSICGSNIEWGCSERHPEWVSITVASFDTEFTANEIKDLHLDTKVCWQISDVFCALIFCTVFEEIRQFFRMANKTRAERRREIPFKIEQYSKLCQFTS